MAPRHQIRQAIAACFAANEQPLTQPQVIVWIGNNYSSANFNVNAIKSQLYRSCVNVESAKKSSAPKILFYDRSNRTYRKAGPEESKSSMAQEIEALLPKSESDLEVEDQSDLIVNIESQLRDYLAKNLGKLEKGLTLWSSAPPSIEFFINGRRIDILAKDISGNPVVIELKRGKAYDKVVGQALLYQALISKDFKCEKVRVILVANEISEELRFASSRQPDFVLFEYELSMQLNPVNSSFAEEEA